MSEPSRSRDAKPSARYADAPVSEPEPETEPPSFAERLDRLDDERRVDALVVACEPALVVWTTYALRARPSYVDSVVGLTHVVDVDLPARALDEVRARHDAPDVAATILAWVEPIVSLQDGDLALPRRATFALYAIHNLHRLVFEPSDVVSARLVLSQAISAVVSGDDDGETEAALAAWWASFDALERGEVQRSGLA